MRFKLVCFIILFIISSGLLFKSYIFENNRTEQDAVVLTGEVPIREIVENITVTQSFRSTMDNMTSIEIMFATYSRINDCTITVTLKEKEDGNVIYQSVIDGTELEDNAFRKFSFEPQDSLNKDYIICVESDATESNGITIWASNADVYPDGELMINGLQTSQDICFKTNYNVAHKVNIVFIIFMYMLYAGCVGVAVFREKNTKKILIFLSAAASIVYAAATILSDFSVNDDIKSFLNGSVHLSFIYIFFVAMLSTLLSFDNIFNWQKILMEQLFGEETFTPTEKSLTKISNAYAVIALVFGLVLIYLEPPISGADELQHFTNVSRIVHGCFLGRDENGTYISDVDGGISELIDYGYNNYSNHSSEISKYLYGDSLGYSIPYDASRTDQYGGLGTASNPLPYIPAALGIIFARSIFGITYAIEALTWGKIANLIFAVILISRAIRKSPIMNNTMFMLSLMPMTIYQCASVSYDTMAIAGSMLLFSCSTRLIMENPEYRISVSDVLEVCFSCFCVFAAKIAYIPFIILLLLISRKKFGSNKRYVCSIICIIITAVIAYLLPTIAAGIVYNQPETPVMAEQCSYVLNNLHSMPFIIANTCKELGGFYLSSFVGFFGWLNIPMPRALICLYLLALAITALTEASLINKISMLHRIFLFLSVIITFAGIHIALYISWTRVVGSNIVSGVQGRYFIPIAIYAATVFANPLLCKCKYNINIYNCIGYASKSLSIAYLIIMNMIILKAYI